MTSDHTLVFKLGSKIRRDVSASSPGIQKMLTSDKAQRRRLNSISHRKQPFRFPSPCRHSPEKPSVRHDSAYRPQRDFHRSCNRRNNPDRPLWRLCALRVAGRRRLTSVFHHLRSKADSLLSFPFTTSMTADHAPRAFSAEMNECLKLGSGGGGANVRVWVDPACRVRLSGATGHRVLVAVERRNRTARRYRLRSYVNGVTTAFIRLASSRSTSRAIMTRRD